MQSGGSFKHVVHLKTLKHWLILTIYLRIDVLYGTMFLVFPMTKIFEIMRKKMIKKRED